MLSLKDKIMAISKKLQTRAKAVASEIVELWELAGQPRLVIAAGMERETIESFPEPQSKYLLEAMAIAQKEIEDFLTEYKQLTLVKTYQPEIRKQIVLLAGIENPNFDSEAKKLPARLFSYNLQAVKKINEQYRKQVQTRGSFEEKIVLKKENVDSFLDLAENWAKTDLSLSCTHKQFAQKLLGLTVLSGRRMFAELCLSAEFFYVQPENNLKTYMSEHNHIFFKGQAKGSFLKASTPYPIRILRLSPKAFIEAHLQLKSSLQTFNWYRDDIDGQFIQSRLHSYFKAFETTIEKTLNCYSGYQPAIDSRKLYLAYVHFLVQKETNRSIDVTQLGSIYLGHYSLDSSLNKIADEKTSASYRKFDIIT